MQKLTARLDGQGLVKGQDYSVTDIEVEDDGFFVSSRAQVVTSEGEIINLKNAHLAFDLGI